jgi:putative transposase
MNSRIEVFVHLVWATAGRERTLVGELDVAVRSAIANKCAQLRCPALAIGGTSDHMHVLARMHPAVSLARLAGEVKGASSHAVKVIGDASAFGWQEGYGAFSVSADDLAAVESYVVNQLRHHAARATVPELELTDDA